MTGIYHGWIGMKASTYCSKCGHITPNYNHIAVSFYGLIDRAGYDWVSSPIA